MSSHRSAYFASTPSWPPTSTSKVHILNTLDEGLPTARQFKKRLAMVMERTREARVPMLKLIHGYGEGVNIRWFRKTIRTHLQLSMMHGDIKAYVPGERWGPNDLCSLEVMQHVPESIADIDFGRKNKGITLVLL